MKWSNWISGFGLAAIALILGLACLQTPQEQGPCGSSADCADGEACNQGECVDAACLSSADCDIDQFCNPSYECEEGCIEDSDCIAGESCNADTRECQVDGCRDTNLDCELGQYCDQTTGECYDSDERHCTTCTEDNVYISPPNNGICTLGESGASCTIDIMFNTNGCSNAEVCFPDDFDAFVEAYESFDFRPQDGTCYTSYKYLYCDPTQEDPCPRGFSCGSLAYSDGSFSDPVCAADCDYMIDNGYY